MMPPLPALRRIMSARSRVYGKGPALPLALAFAVLASTASAQDVCGRDGDPCEVPLGTYRIALPAPMDTPVPAIVFLHGAGGSGRGMLSMTGTIKAMTSRGYAVLAPDGIGREGRDGGFWSFLREEQRPRLRDERAFFDQIVADAADRFGIDPETVILSGFSAGAFKVTTVACDSPEAFEAYAPVAGGSGTRSPKAARVRCGCSKPTAGPTAPCRWRAGPWKAVSSSRATSSKDCIGSVTPTGATRQSPTASRRRARSSDASGPATPPPRSSSPCSRAVTAFRRVGRR